MAYNYEYPHFEAPQYNMDWILETIKRIEEQVLGLDNYNYEGENEILDLNDLKPNSMASFTENFNVLNAPVSGSRRFVFTNGSETGGFQRCYDIGNMEVYSRNFSITGGVYVWKDWKITQFRPRNVLHAVSIVKTGSLDTIKENIVTLVEGFNVENCPTNNYGFLLVFGNSDTSDTVQLWYDRTTFFCYMRRSNNTGWEAWQELNHIDFSKYYQAKIVTDLNDMDFPGSAFINMENVANGPVNSGYFQVLALGARHETTYQIAYSIDDRIDIYTRRKYATYWGSWGSLLRQPYILHRLATTDGNAVVSGSYSSGTFNTNNPEKYVAIIGLGTTGDQFQIAWTSTNNLYLRFRSGSSWSAWVKFQQASTREALIASSLPYNISTDDEGKERMMIEDNMYSRTAADSNSEYLNCPGQSLFHSDPDAQSYSEAILAREDLQNFDSIITNLEQWDMDIPLDELLDKTRAFVEQIQSTTPITDIVLLSVPPIDVPFLGEELYSYTWPSGNTLKEVDEALSAFAQELGFSYITWKDYKNINHTNLLTFYDNLYEEPVYKRSLETYVSRQVKNCIE